MSDSYEVRFTVRLPAGVTATEAQVEEWLRFCLRDRACMRMENPLSPYEPEPVNGTFQVDQA